MSNTITHRKAKSPTPRGESDSSCHSALESLQHNRVEGLRLGIAGTATEPSRCAREDDGPDQQLHLYTIQKKRRQINIHKVMRQVKSMIESCIEMLWESRENLKDKDDNS